MVFMMRKLFVLGIFFMLLLLKTSEANEEEDGAGADEEVEQRFMEVPESVEVNAGEDVFLRCVVGNQQGKVQWTKDGFALGFEREVPGYPRYSYSGDWTKGEHHLVINGTTLEDDGEYQCQVGPTATTSALWAAANVTVMVSPSGINLLGGEDGADDTTVDAEAGETLHLQCSVDDARPAPSVAWYRNGLLLDEDLHSERVEPSSKSLRWNVRSNLTVLMKAEDDGQQYSCRAIHPSLTSTPTSLVASVKLNVLHPPKQPTIIGYAPGKILRQGDHATVNCQVEGGNPKPELTWYKNGLRLKTTKLTKLTQLSEVTQHDENRRGRASDSQNMINKENTVSVSYDIKVETTDDGAVYECRAMSDLLQKPLITNISLTVHYSPSWVSVTGPFVAAVGQMLNLTCVTSQANPPASINWLVQGSQVANMSSLVSEAEAGGWVTSSDLNYPLEGSLRLSEVTVECRASNSASDTVASDTKVINIIRPPSTPVLQVEGIGDAVAGGQLVILCSTEGGNPLPHVTIYKGDDNVVAEVTKDGRVTRARAVTTAMVEDNGAKITCKVNNTATAAPLVAAKDIELLFPPREVKAWASPSDPSAGEIVKIICESSSSIPAATITWSSGSTPLHGAVSKQSQGLHGGIVTRSELEVRASIKDNERVFSCEANNNLGEIVVENITLNVLYEPVWIVVPSGTIQVREKDDLLLRAVADANPPPIKYSWWGGPVMIEDGKPEREQMEGRLEMKRVHRQEAGGYTVTASSPKGTINASFVIDVLYGPEGIMAPERVNVEENGSTNILCSGVGNPPPNITWFKQDDNSSMQEMLSWGISESTLKINDAKRFQTGFYKCLGSNVVETSKPVSTVLAVTQAPEPQVEDYATDNLTESPWAPVGGIGRLECIVRAAPTPTYKWTINEDRILFNSRKYFIRSPQLLDGLIEWSSVLEVRNVVDGDYTTYTCTATNSKGTHVSRHTLGPPIPPEPPCDLNVTNAMGSTAFVSWSSSNQGTKPEGYILRYRSLDSNEYIHVNVPGYDTSSANIQSLTPGTVYEFGISAYNEQGKSDFTSPAMEISVPGVVEEVASSSSHPRMPRLTLLLMSVTGVALLVLNISIIICFIRRYAASRSAPASYKPSSSEGLTPASTAAIVTNEDEDKNRGINIISSQYQAMRQAADQKDEDVAQKMTMHHFNKEGSKCQKPKDDPLALIFPPEKFESVDIPTALTKSPFMNGGLCINPAKSKHAIAGTDRLTDLDTQASQKLNNSMSEMMKKGVPPTDIPDVCPKSLESSKSRAHQYTSDVSCQDDRTSVTSHQSITSCSVNLPDQIHGIDRRALVNLQHQNSLTPSSSDKIGKLQCPSRCSFSPTAHLTNLQRQESISPTPSSHNASLRHQNSVSPPPVTTNTDLRSQESLSPSPPIQSVNFRHQDSISPPLPPNHENMKRQDSLSPTPLTLTSSTPSEISFSLCHGNSIKHSFANQIQPQTSPSSTSSCSDTLSKDIAYHNQPHNQYYSRHEQYQEFQHQITLQQHIMSYQPEQKQQEDKCSSGFYQRQHQDYQRVPSHSISENQEFIHTSPCCDQTLSHSQQIPQHHNCQMYNQQSSTHFAQYQDHQPNQQNPHYQHCNHTIVTMRPPCRYPSEQHNIPTNHGYSHCCHQSPDHFQGKITKKYPSEGDSKRYMPVPHTQREYQYPMPFTEVNYHGSYSQNQAKEMLQLQCIREEPVSDLQEHHSGLGHPSLHQRLTET